MANERLRDALHSQGMTTEQLAEKAQVSPKTAERWITRDERAPYASNRRRIVAALGHSEQYFWPNAISEEKATEVSNSEIIKVYPHRNAVPNDLWDKLFDSATTYVDMLVYVGMFMTEKPTLLDGMRDKAANGARIRLMFGDRDSDAVIQRSLDEGIGRNTISAKIDQAVAHFQELASTPGIEIRTHGTVLYNSIYRFDDEMLVNPHVYGKIAAHAPAMHLRRLSAGDLFTTYADSFTTIWEGAEPLPAEGA